MRVYSLHCALHLLESPATALEVQATNTTRALLSTDAQETKREGEHRHLIIVFRVMQCHGKSELQRPLETYSYVHVRKLRPRFITELIVLLVSTQVRPEPWLHGCSLVLFILPLHGQPTWISFKPSGYRPVPMVLAHIESKNVFQARFKHCFLFCLPHPLCNCTQPPVDQRFVYTLECQDTGCHRVDPT